MDSELTVSPISKDVCFTNWDEWLVVRHGLYSKDHQQQKHALKFVNMWRRRRDIAQSIEATASFVEVQLEDNHFTSQDVGSAVAASSSLRMRYSFAIIRAVNGLVDPGQQNFFAQSVLAVAERMGLPGWIVELRHDGTHKQLPSMSVLRAASVYLLDWFEKHYWQPQEENLKGLMKFCISPAISEFSSIEHQSWLEQMSKYCLSPSFVSDMFVPIFVDATLANCVQSSIKTEFERCKSIWQSSIDLLISLHGLSWLIPSIVRMLHSIDVSLECSDSDPDIIRSRIDLAICWVKFFSNKLSLADQTPLMKSRLEFVETIFKSLQLKHVRSEIVDSLSNALNIFDSDNDTAEEVDFAGEEKEQDESPSSKRRKIEDSAVVKATYKQLCTTADRSKIILCVDFPSWPLGYMPGKFDNSDLYQLEDL